MEWQQFNRDYITASLAPIKQKLLQLIQEIDNTNQTESITDNSQVSAANSEAMPLLEVLCTRFKLSAFERNILLLCIGVEFDAEFISLCLKIHSQPYPTLQLALKLLNESDIDILAPQAPLRYWKLIEVQKDTSILYSPLKIDECIYYYLLGNTYSDKTLSNVLKSVECLPWAINSHVDIARKVINYFELKNSVEFPRPLLNIYGSDLFSQKNVANLISHIYKCHLYQIDAQVLPTTIAELANLEHLILRQVLLTNTLLIIVCDNHFALNAHYSVTRLIEHLNGRIILMTVEPLDYKHNPMITIEVKKPTQLEQVEVWQALLGQDAHLPIDQLVKQYDFTVPQIQSICTDLYSQDKSKENEATSALIWELCRKQTHKQLEGLARHIECKADWNDLVLPSVQYQILQEITLHVAQRYKVYNQWGFADKSARGLGISAIFFGPSGTGKTLAAEVMAKTLQVDLYHIDLSAIVSKYIGETEKNLRRIFDIAEASGAILLFDEADALFGKRSEVKDSHDRHANIEVSYLLQRMESYKGLSILTTNFKNAMDTAFLRRIRFIVNFPFPDKIQREAIWRQIFPEQVPVKDLAFDKLARLNITGGHIRNISVNAAFMAAAAEESITMQSLLQATQNEYNKLGKVLLPTEIQDWIQ